jgi:arsenical-resistance protein 2
MIPNAINLPAQTFHQTLPNLISILSQYVWNITNEAHDRYSHVVFHCSSSNGRGPRCAAWYEDALLEKGIKTNAYILTGGIKKWIELYPTEVVRI